MEKKLIPRPALFHVDNRLSPTFSIEETASLLKFESSRSDGSCLTPTASLLAPFIVEPQCFETLHAKLNILSNSFDRRKNFESCKSKSQLMLTTLNEAGENTS